MKKLSTISLFIFGVVVTAILVAGLVFYQNNKNNQLTSNPQTVNLIQDTINKINPSSGIITLNMQEIAKHNKYSDCWMLISGKVYNITSYFGSHPGGSSTMLPSCGKDATDAFITKDPYATSSGGGRAHSSNALSLLANYYIGNFNQSIGQQTIAQTNSVPAPATTRRGRNNYYDD